MRSLNFVDNEEVEQKMCFAKVSYF